MKRSMQPTLLGFFKKKAPSVSNNTQPEALPIPSSDALPGTSALAQPTPAPSSSVHQHGSEDRGTDPATAPIPGLPSQSEAKGRKFLVKWKETFPWIEYDTEKDVVLCSVCCKASAENLLHAQTRTESAFLGVGFRNWKKAIQKFNGHEKSDCHVHATQKLQSRKTPGIEKAMTLQRKQEQATAQKVLSLMFSSALYLGRQGFPFQGHGRKDGAFFNLVLERAVADDLGDVMQFIERRDNWMSDTIQNEIIAMFGRDIQEGIMREMQEVGFVGVVADGTTDISGVEQMSVCLQYLKSDMTATNVFVGFYEAPSSTGETLANIIVDVLTRFNVSVTKLSGFSFDNASNMSGVHQGVQSRLKAINPNALYVPCTNHSLDLVLQEAAREVLIVADTLQFVKDVANVINESAKRTTLFKSLFNDGEVVRKPLGICQTRWCVRATAMQRMKDLYDHILELLASLSADRSVRGEMRAKILGLSRKAEQTNTYVGLSLVLAIFQPCELVAATLQSSSSTARSALESLQLLKSRLQALRDGGLKAETQDAGLKAADLDLITPPPRRRTQTPGKVRHDGRTADDIQMPQGEVVRLASLEAMDLVIAGLERRFNTPGLEIAVAREQAALDGVSGRKTPSLDGLQLPSSIDQERLKCQLSALSGSFAGAAQLSLADVCGKMSEMDATTRQMFGEVGKLLSLILSLPCTVASAERSFSMLRRLKTYLRTSIGQSRLTHLALMHVHKDRLRKLDISDMKRRFVEKTPERMMVFGRC